MRCTSPFVVKNREGISREVPCGQCLSCRIKRSDEWAVRCVHEASMHERSGFVTLSYADDYLPKNKSLDKKELAKFFKRLRKVLCGERIRYYACGEYGEKHSRPHYHIIIFSIQPCHCTAYDTKDPRYLDLVEAACRCIDRLRIKKVWKWGFVDRVGDVNMDSARYCADYIKKALTGKRAIEYGEREVPFNVMSKGIGRDFADKNASQICMNQGITMRGVQVGLPRYYVKRLGVKLTQEKIREFSKVQAPSARPRIWIGQQAEDIYELRAPRYQKDLDTYARVHIKKKGDL